MKKCKNKPDFREGKKTKLGKVIETLEYAANNPDVFYDDKTVKAILAMIKRIDKYYD